MVESMMYKMCFFEQERHTVNGVAGASGHSAEPVYSATHGGVTFEHIEEAYSSRHRTVRLYRVKPRSEFHIGRDRAFME